MYLHNNHPELFSPTVARNQHCFFTNLVIKSSSLAKINLKRNVKPVGAHKSSRFTDSIQGEITPSKANIILSQVWK